MLFDLIEGASRCTLGPKERQAYRILLHDQDDGGVNSRCVEFFRSGEAGRRKEKIPTAGDLIEQPRARADATALAWATLRKAISSVGSYRSVEFEDPAISATVEALGGWLELCSKSSKELDMLAWQFSKLYPGLVGHCDRKALPGRHDLQNGANGGVRELQAPTRIQTLGSAPAMPMLEGDGG